MANWTATGSGSYYNTDTGLEIVRMTEDGAELTRAFSVIEVDAVTGSFYHDVAETRLYIHTLDDSDPNDSESSFVGYNWLCFTNIQEVGFTIDFRPQNALHECYFLPFLAADIPELSQSVSDYYKAAVSIQFGSLSFVGQPWWWENKKVYLWHNQDVFVKIGEKDTPYDEFITIFPGKTKRPQFQDDGVIIEVRDRRAAELKQIPEARFDTTTYPNLDPNFDGKIIPILFGTKTNITPVNIDTANWIYKISDTAFTTVFAIEDIVDVYKDGVALVEGADFNSDDPNGEFTLLANPLNTVITCDAKGIQCGYNMVTGAKTDVFSENVADILFFILNELNGIDVDDIDLSSFADLQAKRTQRIGYYMDEAMHTLDFVRILQGSAIFHFIPFIDGRYYVQYYDRAIAEDAPFFRNEDYHSFQLGEDTDTAFQFVTIKYDKDPTTDEWKEITDSDNEVDYKYNERNTLTVETALLAEAEAVALAEFYIQLINAPGDKVNAEVNAEGFELIPSDKARFSRSIINQDSQEVIILEEEIYTILEVRKNINEGKTNIVGLIDSQAAGVPVHADSAHIDEHEDHTDHSDSAHEDVAHNDDHDDVAHSDSYSDSYNDVHDDTAHGDTHFDHFDAGYQDDHLDEPYQDDYTDSHTDNHVDIPYDDDYDDSPHGDGHADETQHTDEHTDVPHLDSEL